MPAETHTHHAPFDRPAVLAIIREQLGEILDVDPAEVSEDVDLVEDLGADAMALIEFAEALEEELGERSVGFHLDDEDLQELRTVRDVVDYVVARLG